MTKLICLIKMIQQNLCAVFLLTVFVPAMETSAEFSGAATMPLKAGASLFMDSATYIFSDVPASLINKSLVQTSFANGGNLTLSGTGYVYVISPSGGPNIQSLKTQGFVDIPFSYSDKIWSGLPRNYKLALLEKQVYGEAKIIFKRWGVVVLSDERIDFETITRGAMPQPTQSAALIPEPQNAEWWKQRHAQKLEEIQRGDVELVLLGDSITQRWESNGGDAYDKITSQYRTLNLGYSGDRTQHVLWRLENGELDGIHPKRIVLLIGTNNLPPDRSTPEDTVEGIRQIVSMIRKKLPETVILIHSIFPRAQSGQDPIRKAVVSANEGITALAKEFNLMHVDIGEIFLLPETGDINKELMPDCLHLSPAGYKKWASILLNMLQKPSSIQQP